MYSTQITVRMNDTDMAGIIFFANQFHFAHHALEEFAASEGFSFRSVFEKEPFVFVIRHAAADYLKPLAIGDVLAIHLRVSEITKSSFSMHYDIWRDNELVGVVKTVHVTSDKASRQKIAIPVALREMLTKHLQP